MAYEVEVKINGVDVSSKLFRFRVIKDKANQAATKADVVLTTEVFNLVTP